MKYLKYMLLFVPLSIVGYFLHWSSSLMFFMTCLSIIPLAGYLGEATEEIACHTGPKFGGFLNATFGNATELIIGIFALKAGLIDVVKASLAGSVLGNILLVLGCSILAGGLKHKELKFNASLGNFTATMLLFSVVGLTIPAVFTFSMPENEITSKYESFSIIVGLILLLMYVVGMVYSFKTQSDLYGVEHAEDIEPKRSLISSISILAIATVFIAIESEMLVSSIEPMTKSLGIPEMFVGLILIPIVGNAAEHSTAVIMALKNKMDIAIEISVGSCLQISMFVVPLLVIVSTFFTPMSIVFKPIELAIFGASVLIANQIVSSGKTNWLEGLKLLSVYLIAAVGFFIIN
ncbi:calcium/proton exchanger [Paludicola sp. MB14-C6]|uniref:calcium/proton exchanger n=1 Tax=Paludihabitans sp. MB14-C6 TaxID=3070656 RepID=UPI0027DC76F5|nr:calcium/proton exchanger [Paludicola sp. MB14-C6]WMJ22428.1 calcium/proton exchanger [Paludicola sp. MB14-C6]